MHFIMNIDRCKQNNFSNQPPQACNQFLLSVILSFNDTSKFRSDFYPKFVDDWILFQYYILWYSVLSESQ